MRRGAAILLAAGLLLGLTACGDTVEQIEERAKVKQACEAAGGTFYNAAPGWRCDLATKEKS